MKMYKKSICILVTATIILLSTICLAGNVKADDPITLVSVDPLSQNVEPGQTFFVDISCVPGVSIKSFELNIAFDATYLSANSVVEGDIFNGYNTLFNGGIIDNEAGYIEMIYDLIIGPGNVTNSGTFIRISFTAKQNIGTSSIDLLNVGVTNETSYLPINVTNGNINIVGEIEIDINQSIFNRGFPIRHSSAGNWAGAQSFKPTVNTLTNAEIYLRKFGTPSFDMIVELRQDSIDGILIDTLTFTPEETPNSWEWFTLNFTDITVNNETDYFIVIPPPATDPGNSFGYEWGYAFGNQYDDGAFWFTRDGGGLWRDLSTMYEFTFKTYGYN